MPSAAIGFAHRGARDRAPDNTLKAFRLALALGAPGLESDAWLSAEGTVVLDHDGLIGPPWRRQPISRFALAALPNHIPTLAALYQECGSGFELSLDLKAPTAAPAIIETARAADRGALARLWLCHPDPAVLSQIRNNDGQVHLVHSTSPRQLSGGAGSAAVGMAPLDALHAAALADAALGIDAINLRADYWDQAGIACVHDAGLLAFGWAAQRRVTLDRLLAAGADGVYSDHVPLMMAALRRHTAIS
jgi:glycerophosphoryl diester phosphodiesterase